MKMLEQRGGLPFGGSAETGGCSLWKRRPAEGWFPTTHRIWWEGTTLLLDLQHTRTVVRVLDLIRIPGDIAARNYRSMKGDN